MIIKVTSRAQAVAVLLRGEPLWNLSTGEIFELDLSYPSWQSKREVRRFLARHQKISYNCGWGPCVWGMRA